MVEQFFCFFSLPPVSMRVVSKMMGEVGGCGYERNGRYSNCRIVESWINSSI